MPSLGQEAARLRVRDAVRDSSADGFDCCSELDASMSTLASTSARCRNTAARAAGGSRFSMASRMAR